MWMNHLKRALVVMVVLAGVGTGAGMVLYHSVAAQPQEKKVADDDQAALRAVLHKAIKAAGGADRLKKLHAMTCKATGTAVIFGDNERKVIFTASLQGLDRCRLDIEEKRVGGLAFIHNPKFKGVDGWFDKMSDVRPGLMLVPGAGFDQDLYAIRLAQFLLPLQGKEFELAPLGEAKFDDRPAIGISILKKDYPDLNLYFDKESGLPVRGEMQVFFKINGEPKIVADVYRFAEYQDKDGLKQFTKLTFQREGKKRLEVELSDFAVQ